MKQEKFNLNLIATLMKDPKAGDYIKAYTMTNAVDLLDALIEKDGNVLEGIIYAIENYLDR